TEVLGRPRHQFTQQLLRASPAGVPRGTRLLHAPATSAHDAPVVASAPTRCRLELRGVPASLAHGVGRREVIRDASLRVRAGETVGLVGASGSGKTTLLRIALGLLPTASGSVLIDEVDRSSANARTRREMRRKIALVPQDPLASFPRATTG